MTKNLLLKAFMIMSFGAGFISCSNEDAVTNLPEKEGAGIEFAMNFEDFGEEEKVASRASATPVVAHNTVDLGNGIEADVKVVRDTTASKNTPLTRAALRAGSYTIVAYQGSTVKATWKGTWNGTTFTPASGDKIEKWLDPGIYTFVCFNSPITQSGGTLTLSRTASNVGDALLGIRRNLTVSGQKQKVSFTMKHAVCRARLNISDYTDYNLGYTSVLNNIKATLSSINSTDVPATGNYDVATDTWTNGGGAAFSALAADKTKPSYADQYPYFYFLPSTQGSSFKLTFDAGTAYEGKNMAGSSLNLFTSSALNMQAGHSYMIQVTIHYKWTYLFSDGTTGTIAANPGKTPIGLVVDPVSRTAVALKDAGQAAWTTRTGQQNTTAFPSLYYFDTAPAYRSAPFDYDGYNHTWNAANSQDGTTVKATAADFPAFKLAAEYNPGVPTAPSIGKWYLPSIDELGQYMEKTLSIGRTVNAYNTHYWAFGRVGGTEMKDGFWDTRIYASSTEKDNSDIYAFRFKGDAPMSFSYNRYMYIIGQKTTNMFVRPFVHY